MSVYFKSNNKNLCCGCRGCEQVCPIGAISMLEDYEGFIYPDVNNDICINCGMCEKVCPIRDGGYKNPNSLQEPDVYGGVNKHNTILTDSTSGGIFTAIIESVFSGDDILVFGAEYDEDLVVRHNFIEKKNSISKLRGSKYVQSDLGNSYSKVKQFLIEGNKVIFSGTPCQVAGLKSFLDIDYDNLICIDIVCHGVPSPKVFEMYKEYLENKMDSKLESINFRDKSKRGWSNPYVVHNYKNGLKKYEFYSDDDFILGYNNSYYIRPICHTCPFARTPRVSDITIADFWGAEELSPSFKNSNGTSLFLINTNKGQAIYDSLQNYSIIEKINLKDVMKFNPQLHRPTESNPEREAFMNDLKDGATFEELKVKYLKKRPLIKRLASRLLDKDTKNKIKKIIRK